MFRRVAGVIAGLIILVVTVQLVEIGVHVLHAFPPGTDPKDFELIKKFVASLPIALAFGIVNAAIIPRPASGSRPRRS